MWLKNLLASKGFWIVVGLALLVWGGWHVKGVFDERAKLKEDLAAERKAKSTGQALQVTANTADTTLIENLRTDKEKADGRAKDLQAALEKSQRALRSCRIDSDTLRVLNRDAGAGDTGSAGVDRGAAPAVEAGAGGSTCEALAVTFDENHGRFELVREQLLACQVFYRDVRSKYCRETGAC